MPLFQAQRIVLDFLKKVRGQEPESIEQIKREGLAFCAKAKTLGVTAVTLRLSPESPLYGGEDASSIDLPIDEVIAPFVIENRNWQTEELEFISSHLASTSCILLDIGANIGLFSRQMLHRMPSIKAAVCFEPSPINIAFLRSNLKHLPQCNIVQAALGELNGTLEFFEDLSNIGNYSLNKDAMRGKSFSTTTVPCLKATPENLLGGVPQEWSDLQILWKSDTQGFDELIVTILPDSFWSRVQAGIMEIWRISKPSVDYNRLASILDSFPIRCYSDTPGKNVSTLEIIEYCQGNDYFYKDLLFSR